MYLGGSRWPKISSGPKFTYLQRIKELCRNLGYTVNGKAKLDEMKKAGIRIPTSWSIEKMEIIISELEQLLHTREPLVHRGDSPADDDRPDLEVLGEVSALDRQHLARQHLARQQQVVLESPDVSSDESSTSYDFRDAFDDELSPHVVGVEESEAAEAAMNSMKETIVHYSKLLAEMIQAEAAMNEKIRRLEQFLAEAIRNNEELEEEKEESEAAMNEKIRRLEQLLAEAMRENQGLEEVIDAELQHLDDMGYNTPLPPGVE